MELYIDTTEKGMIRLSLLKDKEKIAEFNQDTEKLSENLLPAIKKFLQKYKVKLSEIKKISVNPGPGPFSAVRSGVAVANALTFALRIKQELVLPKYNKSPNITPPRLPS